MDRRPYQYTRYQVIQTVSISNLPLHTMNPGYPVLMAQLYSVDFFIKTASITSFTPNLTSDIWSVLETHIFLRVYFLYFWSN